MYLFLYGATNKIFFQQHRAEITPSHSVMRSICQSVGIVACIFCHYDLDITVENLCHHDLVVCSRKPMLGKDKFVNK